MAGQQAFNMDQVAFAQESIKDTVTTVKHGISIPFEDRGKSY